MNKPTTNAKGTPSGSSAAVGPLVPARTEAGEYENCTFHKPRSCAALKTWYNPTKGAHCQGCPFFKTQEQYEADISKYPHKEGIKL